MSAPTRRTSIMAINDFTDEWVWPGGIIILAAVVLGFLFFYFGYEQGVATLLNSQLFLQLLATCILGAIDIADIIMFLLPRFSEIKRPVQLLIAFFVRVSVHFCLFCYFSWPTASSSTNITFHNVTATPDEEPFVSERWGVLFGCLVAWLNLFVGYVRYTWHDRRMELVDKEYDNVLLEYTDLVEDELKGYRMQAKKNVDDNYRPVRLAAEWVQAKWTRLTSFLAEVIAHQQQQPGLNFTGLAARTSPSAGRHRMGSAEYRRSTTQSLSGEGSSTSQVELGGMQPPRATPQATTPPARTQAMAGTTGLRHATSAAGGIDSTGVRNRRGGNRQQEEGDEGSSRPRGGSLPLGQQQQQQRFVNLAANDYISDDDDDQL